MTVLKKHSALQRHPARVFFSALLIGLLLCFVSALLLRGIPTVAAAESAIRPVASPPVSFVPAPLLAQKSSADKPITETLGLKADRKNSTTNKTNGKRVQAEQSVEFSPSDENAVQAFLATNHPELGQVLGSLKKRHAREYARAIHDLSHTQSKLEQVRRHDEARYERDLAAWQLKSRIQLLVARLRMSPGDETLRAELKQTVTVQVNQQREHLSAERVRIQQRLEKIDTQLEKLSGDSTVQVEQRMKQWLASAENGRGPLSQKKKGANNASEGNSAKVKLKKSTESSGTNQQ